MTRNQLRDLQKREKLLRADARMFKRIAGRSEKLGDQDNAELCQAVAQTHLEHAMFLQTVITMLVMKG